jgi:hypothetical protein
MARKQTSARVSKIAGKYMGATDAELSKLPMVKLFELFRTVCASCVSQDETPSGK